MVEVQQGARKGQGSDPSAAVEALARLVDALYALQTAWDPCLDVRTYPRYLPDFNTFVSDVMEWREEVEGRPFEEHGAHLPVRPVNLADPVVQRDWLRDVRTQIADA